MAHSSHRKWPVYSWILGITAVIAFGGGTHEYSQLFLLLLTGAFLILTPIRKVPGKWILIAIFSLFAWILVSTLAPLPFSTAADWIASKDPSLSSGRGVSAQPLLSLEKTVFFVVGLCWFFLLIQYPLSHYRRLQVMQWLMWSIGGLAIVTLVCGFLGIQHPLTWGTHRFSFFPNHNQSGAVFAMGAILTLGFVLRSMKKREWEMFAYIGVFAVICLALFLGMSRSAVIIMVGGCIIYLLLTIEKRNTKFYLQLGLPLIVVFAATFILYGGKLLDEFLSLLKTGGMDGEIRVHIWIDATKMALNFPMFGVGLGNFRYFFPFFIDQPLTLQAIHHPESDLLWIWCELGLIGLGLVIFSLVLLLKRLDPVDMVRSKGSRLFGFVAICMFLLASMIEVSGHRLGTALLALLFYGLIQPEKAEFYRIPGLKIGTQVLGAIFILTAGFWGYFMFKGKPLVSTEVMAYSLKNTSDLFDDHEVDDLETMVDTWVTRYPMVPGLRNLKGITAVATGNVERAIDGFDKAHLLNPVWWRPYINHGLYIFPLDFDTALRYWSDGIAVAGKDRIEAFEFVALRIPFSKVADLRDLTYGNRDLQFAYFSGLRNGSVDYSRELGLELAINPELKGFRAEQKLALLWQFCRINGATILRRLLNHYPILGSENWILRAQVSAGENSFKNASRLAVMNLQEPKMIDLAKTRTLTSIRTEYLLGADDPLKVIALVQKQKKDGNYKEALIAIEISKSKGVSHEYLDYQHALILFHLGRYEDSWKRFEKIIAKSIEWEI